MNSFGGVGKLEAMADHNVVPIARISRQRFLRFGNLCVFANGNLQVRIFLLSLFNAFRCRTVERAVGHRTRQHQCHFQFIGLGMRQNRHNQETHCHHNAS